MRTKDFEARKKHHARRALPESVARLGSKLWCNVTPRIALAIASARMPVTVADKLVMEGGVGSAPWVPREVLHADGKRFIGLAATDCQLRRFLGCTRYGTKVRPNADQLGQPAALLESLRSHRNRVVDEMIAAHLAAQDPMAFGNQASKRVPSKTRNNIDAAALAPWIAMDMPAIDGERHAPATTITVLTEMQRCRTVFVEATPSTLEYLIAAAAQPVEAPQPRKRMITCTDAKQVFTDKRRKTVWTFESTEEGEKKRRLSRKVEHWDQLHLNDAASALVAERESGFPDNGHKLVAVDAPGAEEEEEEEEEGRHAHGAEDGHAHGASDSPVARRMGTEHGDSSPGLEDEDCDNSVVGDELMHNSYIDVSQMEA